MKRKCHVKNILFFYQIVILYMKKKLKWDMNLEKKKMMKKENTKDNIFKSILLDAKNQGNKLINKNHHENEDEKNIETNDEKNKLEDGGIKEQYIDHYLICQIVDENKDIFPLKDISDLIRLKNNI